MLPAWLFWVAACAVAVTAGVGVAYFGSPDSGTSLQTSVDFEATGDPAGSAATEESGIGEGSRGSESSVGAGDNESGFAGDALSRFQGTRIQVLNASSDEGAAESLASRLSGEGFSIETIEPARRIYRRTTVFWTPDEGRAAARALAEHFSWRAAPKPANLTDQIPVHVVVGEDET